MTKHLFPVVHPTQTEEWKVVPESDGRIEVSNLGRIREYKTPGATGPAGYVHLEFGPRGRRTRSALHRVVAKLFLPEWDKTLSVNHKNGVKTDNRAENLEMCTLAENTAHQWRIGLVNLRGEEHPGAKLKNRDVAEIHALRKNGVPVKTIATKKQCSQSSIYKVLAGLRWKSAQDAAPPRGSARGQLRRSSSD